MHKNVALIIRNLRQFGGGEKDLITLAKGLNDIGLTPDIFSEENATNDEILHYFGKKIQYTWKSFPRPKNIFVRVLTEIFLSHPLKHQLDSYDFVYDFTNKPPILQKAENYLKYIYVIEDKRVLERSTFRKVQYSIYSFLAKAGLSKFKKVVPGIINVTQSYYIQKEIKNKTGIDVPVIYPPVDIDTFKNNEPKRRQIACLGRISPEKDQLFLLMLAKKLKETVPKEIISIYIIGIIDDAKYFSILKAYVKEHNLNNVRFITNAKRAKVRHLLSESEFFISATKNEHFGIAVVEAIASGCIPLCHNSGGHKEILKQNNSLLFNSVDDAKNKLHTLVNQNKEFLQKERKKLQKHIQKYDEMIFIEKMIEYLR